ncbi:unnamed protein product [Arctogadus glacialis]
MGRECEHGVMGAERRLLPPSGLEKEENADEDGEERVVAALSSVAHNAEGGPTPERPLWYHARGSAQTPGGPTSPLETPSLRYSKDWCWSPYNILKS